MSTVRRGALLDVRRRLGSSSDALVKYTYIGDTDLNGFVDAADLANLVAGMNGGLHGWVTAIPTTAAPWMPPTSTAS